MATIKVRWSVSELANVMSLFDTQKVYRSATGEDGSFSEITGVGTRVDLVTGVTSYLYDDTAGDPSYYYAVSYYNSSTTAESSLSDPIRGDLSGYCSILDIREQGLSESDASDSQVVAGITRATRLIERITGMWFEPRTRTFRLDKRQGRDVSLDIPIIAVTSFEILDEPVSLDYLWVYNRHLTQGLLNPDDRNNPRMEWREEYNLRIYGDSIRSYEPFTAWPMRYKISGVFGYTELDPSVSPSETESGSQVPADYGETPELIKYACMRLVMRYAHTIASGKGDDLSRAQRVVEEQTVDQSYKLSSLSGDAAGDAAFGMTGDREVDQILTMYTRPMSVGAI